MSPMPIIPTEIDSIVSLLPPANSTLIAEEYRMGCGEGADLCWMTQSWWEKGALLAKFSVNGSQMSLVRLGLSAPPLNGGEPT
jgi:hypothetical protein